MYFETIQQFANTLLKLSELLDKAQAYSEERKFDIANLLNARLAPDQFSLGKQIQVACDNAKFAAARFAGQQAPSHPDTEQTVAEFKTRIEHTVDYLRSFKEDDFTDASDRRVVLGFLPHLYLMGHEYLHNFALPNFYFHVTTAYSILRNNGVSIGKQDYMAAPPFKPLESE